MKKKDSGLPSVAIIAPFPPPCGGLGIAAAAVADGIAERGGQVIRINTRARMRKKWFCVSPRDFYRIFSILAEVISWHGKYQVVNIHTSSYLSYLALTLPVILISRLLGKCVVVAYHGGDAAKFFSGMVRFTLPIFRLSDRIVVQSGYLKDVFNDIGVETTLISNFSSLPKSHAATITRRVLVNRSLSPDYCVDTAIKAFIRVAHRYPDAQFVVAADGPMAPALREMVGAAEVSDRFVFLGEISRARMAEELAKADLFVNPSSVDNNPLSLIEAVSCGLPVITTDVGGNRDIVGDGKCGLLVSPKNVAELENAIAIMFNDLAFMRKCSEASVGISNKFSKEKIISEWVDVFAGKNIGEPSSEI